MKYGKLAIVLISMVLGGLVCCSAASAEESSWNSLMEVLEKRPGFFEYGDLKQWIRDEYLYFRTYRYFDRGFACIDAGDYDCAIESFETVLRIDPGNRLATLYLAHIEILSGHTDRAISLFEAYTSDYGPTGYVMMSLAFLHIDRGDDEKAINCFLAAENLLPEESREIDMVRANMAELYMKTGRYKEALPLYRRLSKKIPDDALLAYKIALAMKGAGETEEAIPYCRRALSGSGLTHQQRGECRMTLGYLLLANGQVDDARGEFEKVLSEADGDEALKFHAQAELIPVYYDMGLYKEALALYDTIPVEKRSPDLKLKAAYCHKQLGNLKAAEKLFAAVLAAGGLPADTVSMIRVELAGLTMRQGEYTRSVELISAALEGGEGDKTVRVRLKTLLAEAYLKLGRREEAIVQFKSLYDVDAEAFAAFRLYGIYRDGNMSARAADILEEIAADDRLSEADRIRAGVEQAFQMIRMKRYAAAGELLEALLPRTDANSKSRAKIAGNLAEIRFRQGQIDEALSLAMDAYRASSDPELLILAATLNHKSKRYDTAERLYREVIDTSGSDAALRRQSLRGLGDMMLEQGRYNEAAPIFETILRQDPENVYALGSLMEIAKRQKDLAHYASYAERMDRLEMTPEMEMEVAISLGEMGAPEAATKRLSKALIDRKDPAERLNILRKLGYYSLKAGHRYQAMYYFEQALALNQPAPDLTEQLADMYIHDGRCQLALPLLESLMQMRRGFDEQVKIARCRERIGDTRGAEDSYRAALAIKRDPEISIELAALLANSGQREEAIQILLKLLPQTVVDDDVSFRVCILLSKNYGALEQRDAQIQYAERALRHRTTASDRKSLMYALILTGAEEDALKNWIDSVVAGKDNAGKQADLLEIATWYESAGNLDKAVQILDRAIAFNNDSALRFRRGVLLSDMGEEEKARADFEAVLDTHPEAARYLATSWERDGKPGHAIDVLEDVLRRGTVRDAAENREIQLQLAHLYLYEGSAEKALKICRLFLNQPGQADIDILILQARCLVQLQRPDEAVSVLENEVETITDPTVLADAHKVLGDALRAQKSYSLSNMHYQQSLLYKEKAEKGDLYLLMAENYYHLEDWEQSCKYYEKAISLEPENIKCLAGYGFALSKSGQNAAATAAFKRYLSKYPRSLPVIDALAYLQLKEGLNSEASAGFRESIALRTERLELQPDDLERQQIYGYKKEVASLENSYSANAYISRTDLVGSRGSQLFNGNIPSQIGLEAAWRPPVIGFRNHRIFQLTARLLGGFEAESWTYDRESTQLAVGFRYKPFSNVNLAGSFERLVKIGDNSEDSWLLRGLYGEEWGRYPAFGPRLWHSGRFYLDYGLFFGGEEDGGSRGAFYGELKEGFILRLSSNWGLFPHLIVDTHWQNRGTPLGTYLEGGVGLELTGWLNETDYRAHALKPAFFIQYKWGSFDKAPLPDGDRSYDGVVMGVNFSFQWGGE